jgi:MFS family permease
MSGSESSTSPVSALFSRLPGALSDSGFRRFATSTFVWGTAHQAITLAQGYTLFELTDSTLYLASLGAAVGVPQLLFSAAGGFLNDRLPRKRLLLAGSAAVLVAMAAVAAVYALDVLQPWHIVAAGAVQGGFLGLDWTTRNAVLPGVTSRPKLISAVSADLTAFNLARAVAPLAGGAVLAAWGGPPAYAIIAGLLAANVLVLLTLRVGNAAVREKQPPVWADAGEIARFVRSDTVISVNVLFTAVNALLAGGLIYLMPAFADKVFAADERGLGWLMTAVGAGSLVAGAVLAVVKRVRGAGPMLLASNMFFAGFAALFAVTGALPLALTFVATLGFFNSLHISLGAAALQIASPEEMRGRVFGVYEVAWGMFPLGGLALGAIAELTGLRWAIAGGAAFVAAFTLAVWLFSPKIRSLRFP